MCLERAEAMKKFLILTLVLVMTAGLAACQTENSDESTQNSNVSEVSSEVSELSDEESKITTASSSIHSPLEVDTWGIAAKYCTKTGGYVNVPVRITKISHGNSAKETVKNFTKNSAAYTYTEPEKNIEWVTAEYELSLDDFPVDSGGADTSITAFVTGKDGEMLKNGDQLFGTAVMNITDGKYYHDGTVTGTLAYMLPENNRDYVITLGEHEETQTFFSQKNSDESK